jgi:sec-independent protein translocase protein TatB
MFGIDWQELLVIIIVAVVVIGPKDMPLALRTAGRWIARVRRVSNHFRSGIETMIREAEMEEMEKKWAVQNEKIMREYPDDAPPEMEPTGAYPARPAPPPEAGIDPADEPPLPFAERK